MKNKCNQLKIIHLKNEKFIPLKNTLILFHEFVPFGNI